MIQGIGPIGKSLKPLDPNRIAMIKKDAEEE